LLELNGGDRRIREELEECLAALLPLSVWGSLSDSRGIEFVADVNPPRPNIPTMDEQALTSLAEAAGQTGDHHLAWKAYIEAIYCGRAPSWMAESPQHDAWFSMDTAELWHRAAHHAKKANEATLAYDYLAKYAIFGSEAQFEEAKETFTKWQSDRKMEEEKEGDSAGQEKSLKKVFALYGQIHAHPRVLELIRSKRDGLGTPDELYAAYSKQWKSVLELCNRGVNGAVVYRVALTPNLDPTTIKIPWPCSPASVKEVRVRVVELLGNIE
jgi:hypothetical protein